MGLFDFRKKKTEAVTEQVKEQEQFIMGVIDSFDVQDSQHLLVTGMVYGHVAVGDEVVLCNPGEDKDEPIHTKVLHIEIGPAKPVDEVTNADAALLLEGAAVYPVKIASVVASEGYNPNEIWNKYISALGDVYVAGKELIISDAEFETLSITDLAQMWRLFSWYNAQNGKNTDPGEAALNRVKRDKVAENICKKILASDAIYVLFNKITGEPHMFSRTVKEGEGYRCMPPDIRIFTEAYLDKAKEQFSEDTYEIRRVVNGEDKKGIYNFLGNTFYINGACGVEVLEEPMAIDAAMLVPKPDLSGVREIDIPVMNPDFVRWTLLMGQLGQPKDGDGLVIYKLYYQLMAREMLKAKFLVPMKADKEIPAGDENGYATITKDTNIQMPILDGKDGHKAVRVYTDWKRLRLAFDGKWNALVMTPDDLIEEYDLAINVMNNRTTSGYLTKAMYTEMKGLPKK